VENWNFFEITFSGLNLFSFMLGMTWAFFNQGLFGKRIGKWVFIYFGLLAAWYAFKAWSFAQQAGVAQ
jgi:hypothetical protein